MSAQPDPSRPILPRPYPLPALPPDRFYVEPYTPQEAGFGQLVLVEDSDPFDLYTYRCKAIQYAGKTAFQTVQIGDTYNYGRVLMLDGAIQSSADDEALYHELLVQPAMLRSPEPRDVLIIGGGEGASLREVLAHGAVRSATMVDIDPEVVALCREHLPTWHQGAFQDPRARLVHADGRAFVEGESQRYDVVIVDVVDMLENGPAEKLYTRQFYELLRKRLKPDGIVAVQALEFSFADDRPHAALARTLRTVFPEVHSYRALIPSFLGSWGFLIASDWLRPAEMRSEDLDRAIESRLGNVWMDHLTGDYLKSCFVMDKETSFLLSLPGPILEDGVPFVLPPDVEDVEPPFAQLPAKKPEA